MGLEIITNNAPRPLLDWVELSPAEQAGFDWVDPEAGETFFRYRGAVYCLSEFTRIEPDADKPGGMSGWHGQHGESFFSGVLVRLVDWDSESVIVGRYFA